MLKKAVVGVALAAASLAAFSADAPAAKPFDPAKVPAVLKNPQFAGSMEVQKSFPGPSGLTGWVVKDVANNKQVVLFSTADQNTVLAGMLLDKDGNNLSAAYAEQHIPKPDYTAAFDDISANGAFAIEGNPKAKAEVTVFYDVNCGFCKLFHKMMQPSIDAGDVRVRYLPVAILGADSGPKGAALLASKDVGKSMAAAVGGQAEQSSDKALLAKVASNTVLMKKHGFSGTPAVLYKATSGKDSAVIISSGLPTASELFKNLGINGYMDKLKADPQLAQYLR